MPEYDVEVLAGDTYNVLKGQTTRTIVEVMIPEYAKPIHPLEFQDLFNPPVFAKAPTDSVTAEITAGTAGGLNYGGGGAVLRDPAYCVANKMISFNGIPADVFAYAGGYILSPARVGGVKPFDITTMVDDDFISFFYLHFQAGGPQTVRVWVDDQEVTQWKFAGQNYPLPASSSGADNYYFMNLGFPDRRTRKVRITGITYFGGIVLNNDGAAYELNRDGDNRLGIVSDSWPEALGVHTDTWPLHLRTLTGYSIHNMAVGGTGYVNPGSYAAPYTSAGRKAALAERRLDAILFNGSVNDMAYSEAQVMDAMGTCFNNVREVQGDIPIIVIGLEDSPYFRAQFPAINFETRDDNLMSFADRDPSVVGTVRPTQLNKITGTGFTGATNGSGNSDWKIDIDGIHLAPLGHWDQAYEIMNKMRPMRAVIQS